MKKGIMIGLCSLCTVGIIFGAGVLGYRWGLANRTAEQNDRKFVAIGPDPYAVPLDMEYIENYWKTVGN